MFATTNTITFLFVGIAPYRIGLYQNVSERTKVGSDLFKVMSQSDKYQQNFIGHTVYEWYCLMSVNDGEIVKSTPSFKVALLGGIDCDQAFLKHQRLHTLEINSTLKTHALASMMFKIVLKLFRNRMYLFLNITQVSENNYIEHFKCLGGMRQHQQC